MPAVASSTIDPFAASTDGAWARGGVRVERVDRLPANRSRCTTPYLRIFSDDSGLTIRHRYSTADISDEIATAVADGLATADSGGGQDIFETAMTGIVASCADDPIQAWIAFYQNSIRRLEDGTAAFAPVHEHAESLISGNRVLDVGSCFGFFPLRLQAAGTTVVASDLNAGTMQLLETVAPRLGRPLETAVFDAAAITLPPSSVDTVTALHLVEHLTQASALAVLDDLLRVARTRVVVAVPFEAIPTECYGHQQVFDLESLTELGHAVVRAHPDVRASVHEYHGGWLVLDR